ncbi:MAG TPA: tetratricopeptide repeat protein, partial [Chloroflexia bacterium]|nr:tetratricopeptide repeat protein [Chloroflexia bacterium]
MAANKAIFETAMKRAHDHAWANQWGRALKEYDRALAEFPSDRTVLRNRAQCLLRLRRWEDAETAYSDLISSDPADLFALNRLAEVYLAQRRLEQAAEAYNRLADLYVANNQLHEAVRALMDLARATPRDRAVHERLLKLTEDVGDRRALVAEHIALAKLLLDENDLPGAEHHAEAASALDPENAEVRRAVYAVRRKAATEGGTVTMGDSHSPTVSLAGTGLLRRVEPDPPQAVALAEKANQAQADGDLQLALDLYDQAVRAGAKQPSVFYAAGVLNQQMDRPAAAIPFLERSCQDPEFATSSNYMIGQCHLALNDYASAVVSFERALTGINLTKLTQAEADELVELYTSAAQANEKDNNPGRAASLYTNLIQMFKDRRWQHASLPDLEKKADDLYKASIQSKLEGIGRGSAMLSADKLPDSRPVMADAATQRMDAVPVDEPTRRMDRTPTNEATQLMGTNLRGDPTAQLPGTSGLPAGESQNGKAKNQSSADVPTTLIRQPGSNLRTITEYLRASDMGMLSETVDSAELSPTTGPSSGQIDPEAGAISGEGHIYHSFSNSALVQMEHTSIVVQQLMAEGEQAIGRDQFDTAIDSCLAAISIEPGYLPVHVMLGDIYLRQGKAEEAVTKYQTVLDTYTARKDPGAAAEICKRLMQLQPDNPGLKTKLGLLLMEAGKVDEAASALLSVPEDFYKAGEVQRALEEALLLKRDLPNSAEVALALGTYLMTLGHTQEALVELSRALHLDPGNNKALARLYILMGTSNEQTQWDALQSILERIGKDKSRGRLFMEELHAALRRDPSPSLFYGLAVLAERSGMAEIAKDSLDQGLLQMSISDTSELKESWPMLEALMSKARADLAITAKEAALASQLYTRALDVLKLHGGLDESSREKPLESPRPAYGFLRIPEPSELYYGLAEANASQSDWKGALQALEALKKWMPEDQSVHTRMADIYFRQGNLSKALSELNELLV